MSAVASLSITGDAGEASPERGTHPGVTDTVASEVAD
jgi:hypothetical protein